MNKHADCGCGGNTMASCFAVEDKPTKSRLAEVLGVEEDEEWEYNGTTYRIHLKERQYKDGTSWRACAHELDLWCIIANTDRIIRKPRFTPDELAMLRCFKAAGIETIHRDENEILWGDLKDYGCRIRPGNVLPSLLPGQSVELSEVLEESV